MSHLHGGIEGGLLDEQGCVDDGYLVIEVGGPPAISANEGLLRIVVS